jgi:dUTP pyrophosphatase
MDRHLFYSLRFAYLLYTCPFPNRENLQALGTRLHCVSTVSRIKTLLYKEQLMQKIAVKVKRLEHFKGELPTYGSLHASGFDLRAQLASPMVLNPGQRVMVPTGLSLEIPPGFEIQVRPRSGWAAKKGITVVNTPGTVDADYRGEVLVALINLGSEPLTIVDQDRIAQAVLCPVFHADLVEAEALASTERGAGGFGSTGFGRENSVPVGNS